MTNLNTTIDAYAALKAEIGRLELKKKELEASLADLAPGSYESENYRLTIINAVRETPDKALADKIKEAVEEYRSTLSHQYLTAHTVISAVRTHRIGLPTGKSLAA